MPLTLISATPSPYARKIRIQLAEKSIPFTLKQEVPWNSTTQTPKHNPLEKLPILIFDQEYKHLSKDGTSIPDPIYESAYIVEYIEAKLPSEGSLTPSNLDDRLFARKIEVLADAVCDAGVLAFFEKQRGEDKLSEEWLARQTRKIEGGVKALDEIVRKRQPAGSEFVIGDKLSTADVAIVAMVDFLRFQKVKTLEAYEGEGRLGGYTDRLNQRGSFAETRPVMFEIGDKVVGEKYTGTQRGLNLRRRDSPRAAL